MRRSLASLVVVVCIAIPCLAQTRTLTADDYARAEKFMGYNTTPLVYHAGSPAIASGIGPRCRRAARS